ncbi:unannotated protein [freshwater metagenome]|uniref:Unannotated protein n=1 Tax=freshwater metagenome TaxID=449393 RepID=A0A6J6JUE6_9ZZZZ
MACATGGSIRASIRVGLMPSMPSKPGIEKPNTSASMIPTRKPMAAVCAARFAVTLDFPTPPLPLVTAITRVRASGVKGFPPDFPAVNWEIKAPRCSGDITPMVSEMVRPSATASRAPLTLRSIRSAAGQPTMVSNTVAVMELLSTLTSSTMPSSVMGRRSSGSMTPESASWTNCSFDATLSALPPLWCPA